MRLFRKRVDQDEKLLKNIERYEQKKKAEQQESKILGQKPSNWTKDKRKETNDWKGIYQLTPFPIYDSAKRLTSNMYIPGSIMCLSYHIKKPLKIGKGGIKTQSGVV